MTVDPARINGCLLGAACGDALGAPFEGRAVVGPEEIDRWAHAATELRYTDDTAMMMVVGEHFADALARGGLLWEDDDQPAHARGALWEDELLAEFIREWRRDPRRGYGPGMHDLFTSVEGGTPGTQAAQSLHGGAGSFGNGAAMRTAPAGLLPHALPEVAGLARRVARVTHAHPLGIEGAVTQAVAVALAARADVSVPLRRREFVDDLRPHVRHLTLSDQLTGLAGWSPAATPREVVQRFGNDVTAASSVPAALAAFLHAPDDPGAAITYAIQIGGDTDTIATMTGALAGARCGQAAVPVQWIDRLEARDRLLGIGDRLACGTSWTRRRVASCRRVRACHGHQRRTAVALVSPPAVVPEHAPVLDHCAHLVPVETIKPSTRC